MAHILVVDDDESQREVMRRILEFAGHEVTTAADGLEGLNLVGSQPFALAFVDLYMPRMDGLEAIPKLMLQVPGLKVVAMSGGLFNGKGIDLLRAAEEAGAVRALPKPFGAEELTDLVEELV
jgi:CheY-like chemotaxis protein